MPSVLIQGKLCPRDQQFGSLPKQQPAVSSCAAALPATHCWSLGRNIPIPFLRKGSGVAFETSFEKTSVFMSPLCWQTQLKGPHACCQLQWFLPCVPVRGRQGSIPGRAGPAARLSWTRSPADGTSSALTHRDLSARLQVDTPISDYKCQFSLACQQKQ